MKTNDPVKFVNDLVLGESKRGLESLEAKYNPYKKALEGAGEEAPQAFINDKSVISFASEVSGQNKTDLLNSALLAQLAANKKFPKEESVIDWYKTYAEVLENIGWTISSKDFNEYSTDKNKFEMQASIIDIVSAGIGGNLAIILGKTLDAIKKLSDTDNKIIAFEKNTHSINKGSFQIGIANENNNTVSLTIGAFVLESNDTIKKILFFGSEKGKFKLQVLNRVLTLNSERYGVVRNTINAKLSGLVEKYVAEIDI